MAGVVRKSVREDLLVGSLGELDSLALGGTRCHACGETTLGSSTVCPNCGGDDLVALRLGPVGELWTYTVVRHKPPGNYHGPDPFAPFGLGLVELPEGIRVMSRLDGDVGCLEIGMPVQLRPYVLRTDEEGAEVVAFSFVPA